MQNFNNFRISNKRLATYYGKVGLGTGDNVQYFNMMFDTGSCEFWIPSLQCEEERCITHNRYKETPTFKQTQNKLNINYLSGHVTGVMGLETVQIDNLTIRDQTIGLAQNVNVPILDDVNWDGILGLGFANKNLQKLKISPLVDSIMKQNILHQKQQPNQFSYYLGKDSGFMSFGKTDVVADFQWSQILPGQNYWTIQLYDVIKEYPYAGKEEFNHKELCPQGCKTILDTGTYLIYGPSQFVQTYLRDVIIDDCSTMHKLPNLIFKFKGINNQFVFVTLRPQDYVLKFQVNGQDDCVVGIGPDNDGDNWTFGQVFFKTYFTIFDRDNNRVGFSNVDEKNINQDKYEILIQDLQKDVQKDLNKNNQNEIMQIVQQENYVNHQIKGGQYFMV